MSEAEGLNVLKKCLMEAKRRFVANLPNFQVRFYKDRRVDSFLQFFFFSSNAMMANIECFFFWISPLIFQ